jgi:uncharacterized protein (DUF2062 family)
MSPAVTRLLAWFQGHIPTREKLEQNRWNKPFAHHILRSDLWRFNRRSVPRGVALGLFVGIMIPLAHFVTATLLAVFVRANIPAALAATFIGFPAFLPLIIYIADKIGSWLLRVDAMTVVAPISQTMQTTETDHLLSILTQKGPTVALGMFVLATVLASLGYLVTSFSWRLRIGRKRARRLAAARLREPAG